MIGLIGTCRVKMALDLACFGGRGRNNSAPNIKIHGAGHAKQLLDWSRGAWTPPAEFLPFICGDAEPLSDDFIAQCREDLATADTVLIEISELDEFVCEGVYLQPIYFSQFFMQPRKQAVLDWYFVLTSGE